MGIVPATPPDSTKRSLRSRLITRAHERWPQLADLTIHHRGRFAYVDGELHDGTTLKPDLAHLILVGELVRVFAGL